MWVLTNNPPASDAIDLLIKQLRHLPGNYTHRRIRENNRLTRFIRTLDETPDRMHLALGESIVKWLDHIMAEYVYTEYHSKDCCVRRTKGRGRHKTNFVRIVPKSYGRKL